MDETGKLVLGYLGTDPATNVVNVQSEAKEFNYDDMDEELRRLQTVIREATSSMFPWLPILISIFSYKNRTYRSHCIKNRASSSKGKIPKFL